MPCTLARPPPPPPPPPPISFVSVSVLDALPRSAHAPIPRLLEPPPNFAVRPHCSYCLLVCRPDTSLVQPPYLFPGTLEPRQLPLPCSDPSQSQHAEQPGISRQRQKTKGCSAAAVHWQACQGGLPRALLCLTYCVTVTAAHDGRCTVACTRQLAPYNRRCLRSVAQLPFFQHAPTAVLPTAKQVAALYAACFPRPMAAPAPAPAEAPTAGRMITG